MPCVGDELERLRIKDEPRQPNGCVLSEKERIDLLEALSGGKYNPETDEFEVDNVNSPRHYNAYPVEVIEIVKYLDFCMGNVIKYILRAPYKEDGVEDCDKALKYLGWEKELKGSCIVGSTECLNNIQKLIDYFGLEAKDADNPRDGRRFAELANRFLIDVLAYLMYAAQYDGSLDKVEADIREIKSLLEEFTYRW